MSQFFLGVEYPIFSIDDTQTPIGRVTILSANRSIEDNIDSENITESNLNKTIIGDITYVVQDSNSKKSSKVADLKLYQLMAEDGETVIKAYEAFDLDENSFARSYW